MSVRQLRLVVAAEDYDEAVAFYRDALGLAEREAISGPGGAHVTILDAGRATLELANPAQRQYIDEVEVGRLVAPRLRVAFEVDDTRARTGELTAAGAREIAPPRVTPWRSLNSRLETPAELQITLFQELGPEARAARGGAADISVRAATAGDWPAIWPFLRGIIETGDTYTWDRDTGEASARSKWMREPPGRTVVAVDGDGTVLGAAETHPNQGGAGAHVANAGFMVDPHHAGRGVGRRLAEHVLEQARADGYRAMQFNAVVETNTGAVALWQSLGFSILATVPEAFDHPVHGPVGLHVMHRFL